MKYFHTLLLLLLLPDSSLLHAEGTFDVNTVLTTGVFYGGMNEYVFEKGKDHELSRLEWEEHFVPYIDLRTEFEFWNFFTCVSLLTSIPVKSGVMRDYDYMLKDSDALSNFSQHDALFDKHLEIYPEIGWGFDIGILYLGASVGFLYRDRKWTAADGYAQYPPRGEPWVVTVPKEQLTGAVITYEEILQAPVLALYADISLNKQFKLGFVGNWYPYLDISTTDTHILRKTQFIDKMKGGWGTLLEFSVSYFPKTSDIIGFQFGIGYEGIFPEKGTSKSSNLGLNSWLGEDYEIESQIRSNLFWADIGFIVYPFKLFTAK